MRLQLPSDRLILEQLCEGRNLGANIAVNVDRTRNNINRRMPQLHDYDLVTKIGPVEATGLYEITPRGVACLRLIDDYSQSDEFEAAVDELAREIEVRSIQIINGTDGEVSGD